MARNFYVKLFAAACCLGTSMHVSFACNIMTVYTVACSVTQLPEQTPRLWIDKGVISGYLQKYAS